MPLASHLSDAAPGPLGRGWQLRLNLVVLTDQGFS
jgi:hypothetical protein